MLSLEKTEIEDAAFRVDRLDAQRDQIARLETELAGSRSALDILKDKHNRFTGMMMAAMSDEIKVLISGEVSEQISKATPDWNVANHRHEILTVVSDDLDSLHGTLRSAIGFDIADHQCDIENLIDNHFTFDNYSDSINDMIRDYINDCTVTIDTP